MGIFNHFKQKQESTEFSFSFIQLQAQKVFTATEAK